MFSIRIRPRIREFTNLSKESVIANYKSIIDSDKNSFKAKIIEHHLVVKFIDSKQHFWSPELTLEVVENYRKDDEYTAHKEQTLIRGYISPKPSIWTFFVFAYVGLGLVFLGLLVYGTSQMMLDQPTNLVWYALGCLLAIVAVFIASQFGQKLGDSQTLLLLQFVQKGARQEAVVK
ncbi:MAG: hypothetical protein L3J29_03595 [Cyclobacteriaceae bacterium]|nr:hypothetical protein [Cyclobacteriaceae bacterium]